MALYRIGEFPRSRLKQPDYSIRYFGSRPLQQIEIYSAESHRVGTISGLLVDESGSTLEEIVNSVQKVSDIIAEIAAASSEQSTGID